MVLANWVQGNFPQLASIVKLDGITGQPYPAFVPNPSTVELGGLGIHVNGTIFAVLEQYSENTSVVGINPTTGAQIFSVSLNGSSQGYPYFSVLSDVIVAGDGYAYLAYCYMDSDSPSLSHLMLLRVDNQRKRGQPGYRRSALVPR